MTWESRCNRNTICRNLVLFPLCAFVVFIFVGFYDQIWQFASIAQYMLLGIGTLIHVIIMLSLLQLADIRFPAAVYLLYWFLIFFGVTGARILYRVILNRTELNFHWHQALQVQGSAAAHPDQSIRVLVIGAGHAGSQIIREMLTHRQLREPVAIIDDNPSIYQYKVLVFRSWAIAKPSSKRSNSTGSMKLSWLYPVLPKKNSVPLSKYVPRPTVTLKPSLPDGFD